MMRVQLGRRELEEIYGYFEATKRLYSKNHLKK